MPSGSVSSCFNGAAFFRTRKPRPEEIADALKSRFNGAAFFRTRKPSGIRGARRDTLRLQRSRVLSNAETRVQYVMSGSRKPLQRSRVLSNAETTERECGSRCKSRSFNGAAFFRTRKPLEYSLGGPKKFLLQRSRVLSNAETPWCFVRCSLS